MKRLPREASEEALARSPRFFAATQAAVAGSPVPPLPLLAVLAANGGDEAADALLTVLSRGRSDAWLERLEAHAADTDAMRALLASVTARLEAASAASPFAAIAQRA